MLLSKSLSEAFPDIERPEIQLTYPPSKDLGDLSSSICFQLSRTLGRSPAVLSEEIASSMQPGSLGFIKSIKATGGYVNFFADLARFAEFTVDTAIRLDSEYGLLKTGEPVKTIVEHTSANPNGPIHIGTARNSILGDSLAAIVKARGHEVMRHFYVDDMGRQVAMAAYGWKLLGKPEPPGSPDLFVGLLYASVNVLIEIRELKSKLQQVKEDPESAEEARQVIAELDEYTAAAQDLRERNASLFDLLLEKIEEDPDPEASIGRINGDYERGSPEAKALVMDLVNHSLAGFRDALGQLGIEFDSWDYESSFVWDGSVRSVLDLLKTTPYVSLEDSALVLDCDGIARDYDLKQRWGINENYEVPPLVLVRADGTTLYTTRDIPYTLWKFSKAHRVINVVGFEQTLPQLQLRLSLVPLNKRDLADRLTHFAYELVRLPDFKMGRRMGRYITLMDVIQRATALAYEEVNKRSVHLPEEQKSEISQMVGIGAVKYTLLSVDPMRPVVFQWEKALDFERNSAPFIQYAHARACNILKRGGDNRSTKPDYAQLSHALEKELVMMIARFPETFTSAADALRPNEVAEYSNLLADTFNSFYAALPVLRAETDGLKGARLGMVDATRVALQNGLALLRIGAPTRM